MLPRGFEPKKGDGKKDFSRGGIIQTEGFEKVNGVNAGSSEAESSREHTKKPPKYNCIWVAFIFH